MLQYRIVRDEILLVGSLWKCTALTIAWLKVTKRELIVVRVHRQVVSRFLPLYLQTTRVHLISLSLIAVWLLVWGGELAGTLRPLFWLRFLDKLLTCSWRTFNFLNIGLYLRMIFFFSFYLVLIILLMLLIQHLFFLLLRILLFCLLLVLFLKIFIAFGHKLGVGCIKALSAFTKFFITGTEACAIDSARSFTLVNNILLLLKQGTLARLISDMQVLSRILGQFIRR